jgi:hypothetical protein
MKRLLPALLAPLGLLLILLAAPVWAQHAYAVGDTVDDFTLPDQNGVNVSLSDYPGRIMFLVFWQPG